MVTFTCARCDAVHPVPSWIQRDSLSKPWPHRCPDCGAVHSFHNKTCEVISPVLLPIVAPGRVSPWIAGNHHPVTPGVYDTNWRDCDQVLQLVWSGAKWTHNNMPVRGVLISFRGKWA